MNGQRLTLLVLLAALAFSSQWLLRDSTRGQPRVPLADAGYYVVDGTLRGVSEDGEALFQISADRVQQQPALARVALDGVADGDALPWRMTARTGHIGSDWRQLELNGDVRIERLDRRGGDPIALSTDNLTVLLDARRATTRSQVLIAGRDGALVAEGMTADLAEQRFVLESAVSGRFIASRGTAEQVPQ